MPKVPSKVFEDLGRMLRPPPPPAPPKDEYWVPRLNPGAQEEVFHCEKKYVLCWSMKGSGKTIACLHRLVRHCFEHQDALALIIVRVTNMATKGGAWDKLNTMILPAWKDGNRDKDGKLLDHGLGVQCIGPKFTSQRNEYVWIANQYGGWSQVVLISAPNASQLKDRIKGFEPSFVFVDELTSCDDPIYFESVAAQIGRRPGIPGNEQQFIAATNPESEEHWVYKKWFVDPLDEETGLWDEDFHDIFFPAEENERNLPDGYMDRLKKVFKRNEVENARMVHGRWMSMPSGEGLFVNRYNRQLHVHPLMEDGATPDHRRRIMPDPKHPFIIGVDPGSVYNAFIFWQKMRVDGKVKWVCFDEIVTIRKQIAYPVLFPIVMRRILWWRQLIQTAPPLIFVSDNSAFNQWRASNGSFDVQVFEQIWNDRRREMGLEETRILQAPKSNGSRIERVRLLQNLCVMDELVISAGCPYMDRMLLKLESEKQKPGEPHDPDRQMTPRRSDHLHVFDAATYPILLDSVNPHTMAAFSRISSQMISKAA